MIKVKWRVVLSIIVVISFSGCVLFSPNIAPDCNQSLHPFLLEETDLPPNWARGRLHYNDEINYRADISCTASYYVLNGNAFQSILQYENEESAISVYSRIIDGFAWKNPSDISPLYEGNALDHYLACSSPRYGHPLMCTFIARYGNYVVIYNTHMNEEFMTVEELEQVLTRIDERMSQR